ncbi:NmrA family NAD(P)-binding protein [uncultured Pseudokineococcus sp.]|uniref:NmrA family NAD(P)-binding protein n=1 Tax=uncultured Pseudokineococcus sp. TaxID=1642928 RepID=UPI0026156A3D|nr:NmrA family NAD(P)-binding protein [uncultured Pseudokineococcus sp.]
MTTPARTTDDSRPVLVLGGTGTTGRRVADRLRRSGRQVQVGSRAGSPPFEWTDPATWALVLEGVGAVFVVCSPDLAAPGAPDVVTDLARVALDRGAGRLVLLSGRGEAEAQRAEAQVRALAPDLVVVRASFFMQDFDEKLLLEQVRAGLVRLPVGAVREPFVDVEDVADVATAALLDARHAGATYEVTGPQMLTFPDALACISAALGRPVRYQQVPVDAYRQGLEDQHLPSEVVDLLVYLFTEVLDGRGEHLGHGMQEALGRAPRTFADYAHRVAASGGWG